jgi:hypothetical protein
LSDGEGENGYESTETIIYDVDTTMNAPDNNETLLKQLVETVTNLDSSEDMQKILKNLRNRFAKSNPEFKASNQLRNLLVEACKNVTADNSCVLLQPIFDQLKVHRKKEAKAESKEEAETVDKETKARKLKETFTIHDHEEFEGDIGLKLWEKCDQVNPFCICHLHVSQ